MDDMSSHPYGVRPFGNAIFANKSDLLARPRGLGSLSKFSDEVLLDILGFLNGVELSTFSIVSRAAYGFSMTYDLWRDLTLRCNNESFLFTRTWRDTYVLEYRRLHKLADGNSYIHTPIKIQGLFSDLLYRLWACHSFNIQQLCPGFFTTNDIARVSAGITIGEFVNNFERPNIPVVIEGGADDWLALRKWTPEYLKDACREAKFRATAATAPEAASFTISDYIAYTDQTREEVPLYLFERDYSKLAPALAGDFHVPKWFDSSLRPDADLFRVLGESRRPDYRWLVAGPVRSGSIFHIDPNQTNAWNVAVTGRKKWIFYPPSECPPGVRASGDGADVIVPLSTGEWLLSFWSHHLDARRRSQGQKNKSGVPSMFRPMEAIAMPGDVVFVPHGWWHMVVNLDSGSSTACRDGRIDCCFDDTQGHSSITTLSYSTARPKPSGSNLCLALTQNYVSSSNLSDCLRFLREKTDQISGVRDRPESAVCPETLYEEFVASLSKVLSSDVITDAVAISYEQADTTQLTEFEKTKNLSRKRSHHSSSGVMRNKNQMKHSKKLRDCLRDTETVKNDLRVDGDTKRMFSFSFGLEQ